MRHETVRRLVPLSLDNAAEIPDPCRACVRWELDAVAAERIQQDGDVRFEKEAWMSTVLLEWGSCGRLAYVNDLCVGYVTYAPPAFVPRSMGFATSPVSPDAVLLMTGRVLTEYGGQGIGRMLVQAVAKDLTQRGVRAIEAFAQAEVVEAGCGGGGVRRGSRRGVTESVEANHCLVPADFYRSVGFKTVRPHFRHPRMRLDLRTTLSWREDVEQAIERILGGVRAPIPAS